MAEDTKEKEEAKEGEESPETGEASGEAGAEGEATAPNKKKKIILLGLIVTAILVIVPLTLHFTGILPLFGDKKHEESKDKDGEDKDKKDKTKNQIANLPPPPVTFELDEFLVNLDTPGKQARFLKMTIALELPGDAEKEAIKPYVPRIRDSFQLYLRELREEDVKGSAALYRLREELMLRLSKVVYPIKVNDILFKEILTQ